MTTPRLPDPPAPASDGSMGYLRLEVPNRLRDAVTRHHAHLAALATALEAARIPAGEIGRHLDVAVGSYRAELLALMGASAETGNA